MKNVDLMQNLNQIEGLRLIKDQPLCEYTSFEVGGPARLFLIPKNPAAAQKSFQLINKNNLACLILGAGSNLVVADQGFDGAVLYTGELTNVEIDNTTLKAQVGVALSDLAEETINASLTGFEFASGIPGSLGGALYMNAGAYGGEMKDVVSEITVITPQGDKKVLTSSEINLGYRQSILQEKDYLALEATIELTQGKKAVIKDKIEELTDKRWAKQPMEMPSAGSMFKRPENHYASALIDEAGLKGTRVGDAQVSTKHAGFVVNLGSATAQDIKDLVAIIKEKIYEEYGVELETEPRFIGDFT
mgnify:FL=1